MNKKHLLLILIVGLLIVVFIVGVSLTRESQTPLLPSPILSFINPQGDQVLFESEQFEIIYIPKSDKYIISILDSPFEQLRQQAEITFLQEKQLSQQEACKLKVSVSTPHFANPNEAGKQYPLSFCTGILPSPTIIINPNLQTLSVINTIPKAGVAELANTRNGIIIGFNQSIDIKTAVARINSEDKLVTRIFPTKLQELIIIPDTPWITGTAYTITIKAGLLSIDGHYQLKNDVVLTYVVIPIPSPEDHPEEGI